jgi:hypothetical protein
MHAGSFGSSASAIVPAILLQAGLALTACLLLAMLTSTAPPDTLGTTACTQVKRLLHNPPVPLALQSSTTSWLAATVVASCRTVILRSGQQCSKCGTSDFTPNSQVIAC